MAITSINTLKQWFQTAMRPTQEQFWAIFDSFRHKSDKVPASDIEGMDELLLNKADKEAFTVHLDDEAAHATLFGSKVDKETGKALSDQNFTVEEKNKLAGIYQWIAANVQGAPNLGALNPSMVPAGTGAAYWFTMVAGAYPNAGGVVVQANNLAVIIRDNLGSFTISQMALSVDLSTYLKIADGNKIKAFVNGPYLANSQVNHLGKDWYNTVATVTDDIPGTSPKWAERLSAYLTTSSLSSSVSFDANNMVVKNVNTAFNQLLTTQFDDFGVSSGATIGSDGSGSFGLTNGVNSVFFKDLVYSTFEKYKVEVMVEAITGTANLIIGDIIATGDYIKPLVLGLNTFEYIPVAPTDKTVILKQATLGSTKIRSFKIYSAVDTITTDAIPLFSKNYDVSFFKATNYTNFGTANATLIDGKIKILGTSNVEKRVEINRDTLHENSDLEFLYRENAASFSLFGFASKNAHNYKHNVFFGYLTSGVNAGKIEVYAGNFVSKSFSTEINTNYAVGDVLKLIVKRRLLSYTFQVFNQTKGWKISYTIQTTPAGVPFIAHNQAKPAVMVSTGDIDFLSFKLVSLSENIDTVFAGDSITFGQSGTSQTTRYASLVLGNNLVSGGGADTTLNVKNRLAEIISIKPKRVCLMIGGNDILFGVLAATYQANLKAIRLALASAGIEVVHLFPTPRTGAGTLINFIKTEPDFVNDLKIDTNTPLMNGNADTIKTEYNSGDNLHPNNAGMTKIAEIINGVLS